MHLTNFAGKPYAGKPHVRFDEGAGKALSFPLYSTVKKTSATRRNASQSESKMRPIIGSNSFQRFF